MTTCTLRGLTALDDGELAALAIDGHGEAFAELYDRHEQRVCGFCLRMLGSPHDAADATQETFVRLLRRLPGLAGRELNFIAYLLTTARHACYDMIESGRRVQPVAEALEPAGSEPGSLEEDPERAALLAATREQVEVANAALPARQREVLALREVECLSYDQIAEIMDLNTNAVAQLISRARIKLRDAVRGTALASIKAASLDCDRAMPLIALRQDGGRNAELDWLRSHLVACATCRARQAAMQDAGVSYRLLIPVVPLIWLRQATIARAAEQVGADWSKVASAGAGGRASAVTPGAGPRAAGDAHQDDRAALDRGGLLARPAGTRLRWLTSRRRREVALAITVFLVVLLVLTGSLADRLVSSTTPASSTAPNPLKQVEAALHRRGRTRARQAGLNASGAVVAGQLSGAASGGRHSAALGSGASSSGGSAGSHPLSTRRNPATTGGSGGTTSPTSGGTAPSGSGGSSSGTTPGGSGGTSGGGPGGTSPGSGGGTSPGSGGGTSPGSGGGTSPGSGGP
jgi:RNA polymerase sigma factor (sigma-70 family)